jgi:hypothetical protein
MAGELIFYGSLAETGMTVTAKVYSGDTQVGSDVTCAETGSLAIYVGDLPTASAGMLFVRFISVGVVIGTQVIAWSGTSEVTMQTITAAISALPTPLTAVQVNAEVDTALSDYDGPTKAELDASMAVVAADLTEITADLNIINSGVQLASLLIPHKTDI